MERERDHHSAPPNTPPEVVPGDSASSPTGTTPPLRPPVDSRTIGSAETRHTLGWWFIPAMLLATLAAGGIHPLASIILFVAAS